MYNGPIPLATRTQLKIGKIYKFYWNDTYSQLGWKTIEDIDNQTYEMIHESIGYFIKQTDTWYIIAMHKNPTEGFIPWADFTWIPKGAVQKITLLSS